MYISARAKQAFSIVQKWSDRKRTHLEIHCCGDCDIFYIIIVFEKPRESIKHQLSAGRSTSTWACWERLGYCFSRVVAVHGRIDGLVYSTEWVNIGGCTTRTTAHSDGNIYYTTVNSSSKNIGIMYCKPNAGKGKDQSIQWIYIIPRNQYIFFNQRCITICSWLVGWISFEQQERTIL